MLSCAGSRCAIVERRTDVALSTGHAEAPLWRTTVAYCHGGPATAHPPAAPGRVTELSSCLRLVGPGVSRPDQRPVYRPRRSQVSVIAATPTPMAAPSRRSR